MGIFAVEYTYDAAQAQAMDAIRPQHRAYLSSLAEQGINIASGPWIDQVPGALLLMRAETADEVASLLDADPFHEHSFIVNREIRQWNPVIGSL